MINKKDFVKFMGYIKQTMDKEEKIDTFIRDISSDGYCYMLSDEISHMIEMVCTLMDIEYDAVDDDIQYFIYECDWGNNDMTIIEVDGVKIRLKTLEDLYDYIVKYNK